MLAELKIVISDGVGAENEACVLNPNPLADFTSFALFGITFASFFARRTRLPQRLWPVPLTLTDSDLHRHEGVGYVLHGSIALVRVWYSDFPVRSVKSRRACSRPTRRPVRSVGLARRPGPSCPALLTMCPSHQARQTVPTLSAEKLWFEFECYRGLTCVARVC